MAAPMSVSLDTPITIKVAIHGTTRRLKVPLRDLGANVFEGKLRSLLAIPPNQEVIFERFSDSSNSYVVLDATNTQVYKTLFRAAKAKLKLRLRATIPTKKIPEQSEPFNLQSGSNDIPRVPVAPKLATVTHLPIRLPLPIPTVQPAVQKETNSKEEAPQAHTSWSVDCNHCEEPMINEHVHCNICDNGDYDLCQACVEAGHHCKDEEHWLIKRFVQGGKVVNSISERVAPKPRARTGNLPKSPLIQTLEDEKKPLELPLIQKVEDEKKCEECLQDSPQDSPQEPTRTCNSCVKVFPEAEFVTCKDCDDYDLCMRCHLVGKHGHHPAHTFSAATQSTTLSAMAEFLCAPGRNVRHAAVCDGCDKYIYGVRHKCLNCPDWDYCSKCIKNAKFIHPGHPAHRFVPIYDVLPEPRSNSVVRHHGIYCDGPLCKDKDGQSYIQGVRYKCAVCHDTDFCANCEAAPINRHNHTHPLIKFKTPVRNVNVTTMGEKEDGSIMATMGDQIPRRSTSTRTATVASANAATQVQTIVDVKPSEEPAVKKHQIKVKDLLAEPIQEKIKIEDLLSVPVTHKSEPAVTSLPAYSPKASPDLVAHFVRDTVTDGTKVLPGALFTQVWTLRNPGPKAWPAGCSIRYVGGDSMLNVDDMHPSTADEINEATESNVIGRPVEVNEEVCFRVMMKAPKREGTAISYWRLKAADGTPFGHRLWCHIDVTNSNNPASIMKKPSPGEESYREQLAVLEAQNRKRLAMARQQQRLLWGERARASTSNNDTKKSIDETLKRHAEVRALTIQNMRRATEQMNAEMERMSLKEGMPTPEVAQAPSTSSTMAQKAAGLESKGSMIFPQLEKESPVSSTHEAVTAPQSAVHTEQAHSEVPASPSVKSDLEFFEDAETIEYSDSESDDGFATEEEYDILDASDQELP